MKKLGGLAAVIATLGILSIGNPAYSGERQEYVGPDVGSWQFEGARETGSLPKGEDLSKVRTDVEGASAKAAYGGIVYRTGIDTH